MVSYTEWVAAVHQAARDEGASVDSLSDSRRVLQAAAAVWGEDKAEIRAMSEHQAVNHAAHRLNFARL